MFGNIGGDVLRIYYATNLSKENKVKNGFTILVDRFVGLSGLLSLGLISFLIIIFVLTSCGKKSEPKYQGKLDQIKIIL